MSKRAIHSLARGLLVLTLLTSAFSIGPGQAASSVRADEIDCDDLENVNDPECVEQRGGAPPPSGGNAQSVESQDAPPPTEDAPSDGPPRPDSTARASSPGQIVFALADAGKEATQYKDEAGSDNCGAWARTRFERDRTLGSSRLGPNVIDTKAWVCKDVDAAKALFKQQAGIKTFPERTEKLEGLIDKFNLQNLGEETFHIGGYLSTNTVWHHYRVGVRKGKNVGIIYLFGRRDIVDIPLVEWFSFTFAGRV
jgi:hypothetical protein